MAQVAPKLVLLDHGEKTWNGSGSSGYLDQSFSKMLGRKFSLKMGTSNHTF